MKSEQIAFTIMTTTQCSAGCKHCPFSDPKMRKQNLEITKIINLINKAEEDLVVLSGGEFFEHSQIDSLLCELKNIKTQKFRITTGGHIDLAPYISTLKQIQNLEGISIGTDTINLHAEIWTQNLLLLEEQQIPYSLTFTLISYSYLDLKKILQTIKKLKVNPQFVYVRVYTEEHYTPFSKIDKLTRFFIDRPLLVDYLQ